ncbi:MAG: uroporphyrinogen-III synthase, partial [Betaproteobacteria bacterium]|nr:uroporphyrinogen-III synthase [Betaproteobacteria bacterium]
MDEDPRPLSGLVLAVTRPADQARATGDFLGAAGADVVYFPVLAIEALPGTDAKPPASGADSVIFVSANAVEFGWDRLRAGGAVGTHTKVFAIGEATAAA